MKDTFDSVLSGLGTGVAHLVGLLAEGVQGTYAAYTDGVQWGISSLNAALRPHLPDLAELFVYEDLNCSGAGCVTTEKIVPGIVLVASWIMIIFVVWAVRRFLGAVGPQPMRVSAIMAVFMLAGIGAAYDLGDEAEYVRSQARALAEGAADAL